MNIKLIPDFTAADIDSHVKEFLSRVTKVTLNELNQVGLEFVRNARLKTKSEGGFDDQTGNLRNSIGYVILYDGQVVAENFEQSASGSDPSSGVAIGDAYAKKEGISHGSGWAIITVAGMEYASWVEAKGYDVISGSTLEAQAKLELAFKRILSAFE